MTYLAFMQLKEGDEVPVARHPTNEELSFWLWTDYWDSEISLNVGSKGTVIKVRPGSHNFINLKFDNGCSHDYPYQICDGPIDSLFADQLVKQYKQMVAGF